MGFSRQEYWSGLPFPPPGDIPDPGIERTRLVFSALAGRFFTTVAHRKPLRSIHVVKNGQISSFLWLSSIPLCVYVCVYTTFSLPIHPLMELGLLPYLAYYM